jgi:glycosyltransferase involved in cell wall biosynthesis
MNIIKDVTGITVTYNTKQLIQNAYESVRRFHPLMKIIIIDGSDANNECHSYVENLSSDITTVAICTYNIGHGRGMDAGIRMCKTKFALIFDSDIIMVKSPVLHMLAMMEDDTYGVGYLEKTGFDGYEYGAHKHHKQEGFMMMMHPFFHLLQVKNYFNFYPYVHHGAPCFKAALDIHNKGLSEKILKPFPGLGHTAGMGWCWTPVPGEWVIHHTAGTRSDRVRHGKPEIEPGWER